MSTKSFLAGVIALSLPALALGDSHASRLAEVTEYFAGAEVISGPDLVDCKLSGGTETTCFSITVVPVPATYTPGPWCPRSIDASAETGGIWFFENEVVDVDGAFITKLPELYGDDTWQLFDPETGAVNVTDSKEACEAAARPNVDPAYYNHCVECLIEYMEEGAAMTYVIPVAPEPAPATTDIARSGAGIARNGVRLDAPAPVEAILSAYTIAAFDDCAGHVNTHVGYHYHAVTDCISDPELAASHGQSVGLAMDGYEIFAQAPEAGDLDACNGHESDGIGYHYHAGPIGGNAILGCLKAQTGCALEGAGGDCDATQRRRRP